MPRKAPFDFNMKEFINMDEKTRIIMIHEHPFLYKEELKRRQGVYENIINRDFDGRVKNNPDAIRTSNTGKHSDPTANAALGELEYDALTSDSTDLNDLKMVDGERSSLTKGIMILKRSIALYEMAIEIFPEDVKEILKYRMDDCKISYIVMKVGHGQTYVTDRITRSYKQLPDIVEEVLELIN
ncbi:MAG: hypothetical protein IKN47_00740 [Lachnospiraceae bacterium]|nr:hypothetical protein [Lachnospiraceae bacterium]